jgi:lysyl-tRNA synthetase, class II
MLGAQAYADYEGMAQLTRTLYRRLPRDVFGSATLRLTDDSECDTGGEWAQISLFGAVFKALGEQSSPATCRTAWTPPR